MLTRTRKALYRLRGHCPAVLAGERFRCDPYHSRFWRRASAGLWEPETFRILSAHLKTDTDYLDIGAWIGPTVLFAARRARHVWAFEPDPAAFRALGWNLELNALDNVTALPAAIWDKIGVARMAGFRGEAGDSTTSLLNPGGAAGAEVLTIGFDDFAGAVDLSGVVLVKIDIEGAEFDVVPRLVPWLERQRPALLLSTHAPYLPGHQRRARMAALGEALAFYGSWQTAQGRAITPGALTEASALDGFHSYLLTG
ncbi:FkbM family methyltransferase [Pseudooceanicola lipolyticus]|uniref:FkbM family methyltransferase n=1 Tax=Pseudooceanicola lipolyticus TaxID=2029104 RepID=A0A2M8IUH0_9RHOB|nr:FkbM family methyltransferase [Pseudooceanicola lipolyticus]PJE34162.1 FkbM family methyltransferase [Pseudooceanicola lipolyticus]